MTTLIPRPPYTEDELRRLYPSTLELRQVQVLMRHGERTPVSARFQNAGLRPFWPYCHSVRQIRSAVLENGGDMGDAHSAKGRIPFTTLEWKRRIETFGPNDEPVVAAGPSGEVDDICDMGSLTDLGRHTTSKLGARLRLLYVDQLGFLPPNLSSFGHFYLRSTPVTRALESLQQTLSALFPPSTRTPDENGRIPVPVILSRAPNDETLYPNDGNCRRYAALARAFAQRAADRWNETEDMKYLTSVFGKWMPENSPRVAVDSRPRLSGIMDTINATRAHGPQTKLPDEFYDEKAAAIIAKIANDEWFSGYKESREYRMLGVGGLLGDIVARMVRSAEQAGQHQPAGNKEEHGPTPADPPLKFGLSGCHDTTLAGVLASLGAFHGTEWPPFTSHIALEMFAARGGDEGAAESPAPRGWWAAFSAPAAPTASIGRRATPELTAAEAKKLEGFYVRLRYNDVPVTIPGCKGPGKHLEGDETFCTLVSNSRVCMSFFSRVF